MRSFFSDLEKRIKDVDSLLCVGIDPHTQDLADQTPAGLRDFCLRIIESTFDVAAAYKPNAAFFEAFGGEGVEVLGEIIRQIPDEIPVILDVKRGDISSTAQAYARAAFEILGADAVTINPYLGQDAIQPFIQDPSKGAFVLCKTSNPGSSDLQGLMVTRGKLSHQTVYEEIATMVKKWNSAENLGLVVGATQVEALIKVRKIDSQIWILAPGVGAQGGDLQQTLEIGLREDGYGLLIPVSRSISRADDLRREAERIRTEINTARDRIMEVVSNPHKDPMSGLKTHIADQLFQIECIQFGEFTLKSGQTSPIYIDLRRLVAFPELLEKVAQAYIQLLQEITFNHLAALPYAALPITTAVCLLGGWTMVYPRKEEKSYGTKAQVEGVFASGEKAVVIDDLITTGGSKLEGIHKLAENGLDVEDIVVLIDRSRSAGTYLAKEGYQLHSYFSITELLDYYLTAGYISKNLFNKVQQFIEGAE